MISNPPVVNKITDLVMEYAEEGDTPVRRPLFQLFSSLTITENGVTNTLYDRLPHLIHFSKEINRNLHVERELLDRQWKCLHYGYDDPEIEPIQVETEEVVAIVSYTNDHPQRQRYRVKKPDLKAFCETVRGLVKVQMARDAMSNTFLSLCKDGQFNIGRFYFQRLRAVWYRTAFPNFLQTLFYEYTDNTLPRLLNCGGHATRIVAEAIDSELRYEIVGNLRLSLQNFMLDDQRPYWQERALMCYQALPKEDQNLLLERSSFLERRNLLDTLGEVQSLRRLAGSVLFIAQYAQNSREEWFREAFESRSSITYGLRLLDQSCAFHLEQGAFSYELSLHLTDETMRGLFFKVKDQVGKTRGYVLGSHHCLPRQYLGQPRKVWRSFHKAEIFMPEGHTGDSPSELRQIAELRKIGSSFFGCMDAQFCLRAYMAGKRVIPSESNSSIHKRPMPSQSSQARARSENEVLQRLYEDAWVIKRGDLESIRFRVREDNRTDPQSWVTLKRTIHARNLVQVETFHRVILDLCPMRPFMISGAGHLIDMDHEAPGVLTLLRQKGWTVQQVW